MAYKRILTIQDISCVGQCSTTVALPILSVMGHETCILPTAIMSTHTGGFGKPAVVHLTQAIEPICRHWQENSIGFDAVLVGYLGSVPAVEAVKTILDRLLVPGGLAIVDPAMADHGRLYSGLDQDYALSVGELCQRADIILPNLTEAAMLTGERYTETLNPSDVSPLLSCLGTCVMTGVGYTPQQTGFAASAPDGQRVFLHDRFPQSYHGTGDMFAAVFTGALMQLYDGGGKPALEQLYTAGKLAAEFVSKAIDQTRQAPAHWYGVKFETVLPELAAAVQKIRNT